MHPDGNHPNTSSCRAKDTCQFNKSVPLAPDLRLDSSAVEQGCADVSSQGITRREETAGDAISNLSSDLDDALHDAQQLAQAAERMVKESCGEDWLLQPFIPDMERNEYRWALLVNMACMLHTLTDIDTDWCNLSTSVVLDELLASVWVILACVCLYVNAWRRQNYTTVLTVLETA